MHQLCQRRTLDRTLLADCLVTVPEDWLGNAQAWLVEDVLCQDRQKAEDITHKEVQDLCKKMWEQMDQEFQARLLALEHEQVKALQEQNAILA
ncbi:hypothetical protein Y1Q_0019323 [Alligator mississippiensis]|uniref:Uncharacterized protein n=1 Tax=Alligator mississippiensis TaxID=8496 RepID=A0A151MQS6_ALLMI|nr:hypothetical protein Y1Q_0019323 [Alligator mississippiensis]